MTAPTTWTDARFTAWKQGAYDPVTLRRAIKDLQGFRGQPIAAIAAEYWRLRDTEEQTPPSHAAAALTEFYQTTDRYLYESTYFEGLVEYQRYFHTILQACRQFRKSPVLDFGGGAGGMCLTLSLGGVRCDYADVPGPTSDYARFRLQRHGCMSQVVDATQSLPAGRYQAVVTLDVFEHLPDLRATLAQLARTLAPGGWLIAKSTFAADDPLHLPQNLIYADVQKYDALLAEFGFRYRGRLKVDPLSDFTLRALQSPRVFRVRLDRKLKVGGRFLVHELVTP